VSSPYTSPTLQRLKSAAQPVETEILGTPRRLHPRTPAQAQTAMNSCAAFFQVSVDVCFQSVSAGSWGVYSQRKIDINLSQIVAKWCWVKAFYSR
jgi:hypothetical protein